MLYVFTGTNMTSNLLYFSEIRKQKALAHKLQEIKRKISIVMKTFHKCRMNCVNLKKKIKTAQEKIVIWRLECGITRKKIIQIQKQDDYYKHKPNAALYKLRECKRKLTILTHDELKFVNSLHIKLQGTLETKHKLEKRLSYLAFKRDNMSIRLNKKN